MIALGLLLMSAGAAGLVVNVAGWIGAYRHGSVAEQLHPRRRTLVRIYFIGVLAGAALVMIALL